MDPITEYEAVKAVMAAIRDVPINKGSPTERVAIEAVRAAIPIIAAKAWDEGYSDGNPYEEDWAENPYRK